jgi:hypothetical protein
LLDESPSAYRHWRNLLVQHQVVGLAVHDSRLVSAMEVANIRYVLTLNATDFNRYQGVMSVTPKVIIGSRTS